MVQKQGPQTLFSQAVRRIMVNEEFQGHQMSLLQEEIYQEKGFEERGLGQRRRSQALEDSAGGDDAGGERESAHEKKSLANLGAPFVTTPDGLSISFVYLSIIVDS